MGSLPVSGQLVAAAAMAAVVLVVTASVWLYHRRRQRNLLGRLRRAAQAYLAEFVIPDGHGGQIHVQHALLTRSGIVVLDIKDVDGHVFGSESMQDWTVLSAKRRFTFANPQPALWDRVAAVRRLVPDVPVVGYVAFTPTACFSKGRPRDVIMLESLLEDIAAPDGGAATSQDEALLAAWDRLQQAARDAVMAELFSRPA